MNPILQTIIMVFAVCVFTAGLVTLPLRLMEIKMELKTKGYSTRDIWAQFFAIAGGLSYLIWYCN